MKKLLKSFDEWKKKTFPKTVKIGEVKVLKTKEEKCVIMDVEMDEDFILNLLQHAEKNMAREEKETLLINWAFNDLLKKAISQMGGDVKKKKK